MLMCLLGMKAYAEMTFAKLPLDVAGIKANKNCYLPDQKGYEDPSLKVRIETDRAYDTNVMLAYVEIADASQIRTTMADRYGTTRVTYPENMAKRVNAVLAVNGDFFNYRNSGYLVRQGILYRDKTDSLYDLLIIDDQGDFHILKDPTPEDAHSFPGTIINTFNFGPALVIDGEEVLPVKRIDGGTFRKAQRMAACQIGPLSYVFVAVEGPENKGSVGMTIEELIHYVHGLGVKMAYNLDGGSSSSIILDGMKINATSNKKRRTICDILYFSTLIPTAEMGE